MSYSRPSATRRCARRSPTCRPGCQQLIALLIEDPLLSYAELSARLGIPAGSIGPSRSRCLDKLRRHPAVAALINLEIGKQTTEYPRTPAAQ